MAFLTAFTVCCLVSKIPLAVYVVLPWEVKSPFTSGVSTSLNSRVPVLNLTASLFGMANNRYRSPLLLLFNVPPVAARVTVFTVPVAIVESSAIFDPTICSPLLNVPLMLTTYS